MALSYERASESRLLPLIPHLDDPTSQYAVLLSRDAETGRYNATVPDLPGFTCEAASAAEAKAILRDAVAAWTETMRTHGKSVPKPIEYTLDLIDVRPAPSPVTQQRAAQQFAESVARVFEVTEQARREFLIAEDAITDARFADATRHAEWCSDLLMQADALLAAVRPHGELERVHKLFSYGLALTMRGARAGLHATCERDAEVMCGAEDVYIQGMKAIKSALAELRRFVSQP